MCTAIGHSSSTRGPIRQKDQDGIYLPNLTQSRSWLAAVLSKWLPLARFATDITAARLLELPHLSRRIYSMHVY